MVYVLDKAGHPLMPTERYGKVRRILRSNEAKVVKRCPFTIQLMYRTTGKTQSVSLGVDAGSKTIGISATTESKVLYEAEITLRNNIVELLSTRRELRRLRRNRKTRYRKPRFNNRKRKDGWLAPSVQQKIDTHLTVVKKVCSLLPISNITVETASFDIQKIKNPDISGKDYQRGEQLGFWNVREYVLSRDDHICQCCKGKSNDKVLNIHHIESRKTGGDAPNNLITLCETCHKGYHKGTVKLPKTIHRGMSFRDAAFMGIMRWAFYNKLKEKYESIGVSVNMTYGYITKNTRIKYNLPKEHYIDARCISGNPNAKPSGEVFYQRKVRCHNRQIHKTTTNKGHYRKLNQQPYILNGLRLYDKVIYNGKIGFVAARRKSGSYRIRDISWQSLSEGVTYKKLTFLETRKSYICDIKKII